MFPVQVLQDLGTAKTLEAALHVAVEPFQRLRPQKPVRRAVVSTAEWLQCFGVLLPLTMGVDPRWPSLRWRPLVDQASERLSEAIRHQVARDAQGPWLRI